MFRFYLTVPTRSVFHQPLPFSLKSVLPFYHDNLHSPSLIIIIHVIVRPVEILVPRASSTYFSTKPTFRRMLGNVLVRCEVQESYLQCRP